MSSIAPARPAHRSRIASGVSTDGYRYALAAIFVLFATSVDVFNVLDRGGAKRYLILLIPVAVVLYDWTRRRTPYVRRTTGTDKLLIALWLLGIGGSTYASLFGGVGTSARSLFLPLGLALLYLLVLQSPTDRECRRILRAIMWVGAIYILLAALINSGIVPHLAQYKQFRNAQFAIVMIGLTAAIVTRRWPLVAALVALEAINFAAYPSATSILCGVAGIVTFSLTKPHGSHARPYLFAALALLVTMFALAHISRAEEITGDYFLAVGKTNANAGRVAVWTTGIEQWKSSPFVGNLFTGGTVAQTFRTRNGQMLQLPFHNDYVLFLREGGMLGLGLLVALILGLNLTLARAHRRFSMQGRDTRAGLVRVLMVGFNCFFVAAAFNPVLEGVSRAAVVGTMYGLAMLVCRDDASTWEAPVAEAAPLNG
jgi:hypothetical protein